MKKVIRLTEGDLHRIIKESVKKVIMEYETTPNDNYMQRSMNNGGPDKAWEQYISQKDTYYGTIAKLAAQNNHSYTDVLRDLQNRINNYKNQGWFGTNEQVLNTIGKFCSLLAYLNGAYESAIARMRNNGVRESLIREWDNPFAGITYKDTNKYGVKQKVGNDKRGQWMKDLQAELQQLLEWNYLHGPKTVEATNAFIEFLEVEKRGLMGFNIPLRKMAIALAGLALLAGALNTQGVNTQGNSAMQQQQQQLQQPQTQQVQQATQPSQNIPFQVNSAQLSQQAIQALQQMGQNGGTFEVIVHESQNSNGMDAPNELNGQLIQARINAIQSALGQNVRITASRGTNYKTPYVEVRQIN